MTRHQKHKFIYTLVLLLLFVSIIVVSLSLQNAKLGVGSFILLAVAHTILTLSQGRVSGIFWNRVDDYIRRCQTERKRPVNHDVEKAAREAFKDALLVFIRELPAQGLSGLAPLRDALQDVKKEDATPSPWHAWPDFQFLDKPETFRSLWSTEAQPFSHAGLEQAARQWLDEFTETPVWVRDAARQKTGFSALWAEFFRRQVKHNQLAATAHSFTFLSSLTQPVGTPSASRAGRRSKRLRIADEILIRKIKDTLPVAPDMAGFLSSLESTLKRQQQTLLIGMAVLIVCLSTLPLGYAIYWHDVRSIDLSARVNERVRYLEKRYPDDYDKLDYLEKLDIAHGDVAKDIGISKEKLKARLASDRDNVKTPLEKSRIALAQGYREDAEREGERAVAEAKANHAKDLQKLSDAYQQYAFSLEASGKYGEAVATCRKAIDSIPKADAPEQWAELQGCLGNAANTWASRSTGDDIRLRRDEAIQAYHAALTVYTQNDLPQEWVVTQNNLGVALQNQALTSDGERRAELLAQAIGAYREALKVYTQKELPQDWARTQNNLGTALQYQALVSGGEQRAELLARAIGAYREALKVYTQKKFSQGWVITQSNLGNALREQAEVMEDKTEKKRLLNETIVSFEHALTVWKKDHFPQYHRMVQRNLDTVRGLLEEMEK